MHGANDSPAEHKHSDSTHRHGEIHIKESHVGLLHKEMHVKAGHKLSTSSIEADKAKAERSGNSAEVKRDTFALNARKWHHG